MSRARPQESEGEEERMVRGRRGGGCGSVKKSASPADGEGPTSRQAQWEGLFYNRTHNPEAQERYARMYGVQR